MAYRPKHNYRSKDALERGDPDKKVLGRELSEDFEAISADLRSKEGQINDIIQNGGGGGGGPVSWNDVTGKPTKFPPADHTHDYAPVDHTHDIVDINNLQSTLDNLSPDGHKHEIDDVNGLQAALDSAGGTPAWDDVTGKPAEFPPSAHDHDAVYAPITHTHEIDDLNGLQDALDAAGEAPAWDDVTGKPTEFPPEAHTHAEGDIDGLEDRLTSIEGSISSGGGFVEAPNDGKLYGRQSEAWEEVVIPDPADPDWADIQNKPTEYPPEAHTQGWDTITDTPSEYPPEAHTQGWDTITDTPSEYPPEAHTHQQGDIDGLDLRLEAIEDSITSGGGFVDAPNDGKMYGRQSESWAEVVVPDAADPDWSDIQNKPSEYPPSTHTHSEYLTAETDPTVPSHVKSISQSDIDSWNASASGSAPVVSVNSKTGAVVLSASDVGAEPVFSKNSAFNKNFGNTSGTVAEGNHTHSQYLESFTETDPTVPSHVKSITTTEKANWNTAFGWGDHATAGYLTSFTETDPTVPSHVKSITTTEKSNWNTAFGWGDHATAGYLTSFTEADPTVPAHVKAISQTDIDNWNNPTGGGGGKTYGDGNGITVDNTNDTIAMSGSYTGDFTASGDIIAFSDARLKDNVETLDGSKVFEMRGVSFTKDGRESSGVIAQEIQKVAPELVYDDGEYLGVAYGNLVGYLIEAVKELKAEIESLKNG